MIKRPGFLRFLTYALVGAVGTLVQYAVLVACVTSHWTNPATGSAIGAIFGAIVNYFLNARYTFRHQAHGAALPKFAATAALGAAMNWLMMKVFAELLGVYYLFAQVIATAFVLALTYVINLVWTFRRSDSAT